ncbi:hypothetical protein BDZ89DRAFT_1037494 [Hymenopellis radicata]|nr:hypothetical protein BDZ89DRAFT_1037494 [Hymenopellis radicata]
MPAARCTRTTRTPTKPRYCSWVLSNILSRMSYRNKSDKHTISPNIRGSPHTSLVFTTPSFIYRPSWPTSWARHPANRSLRLNQQGPASTTDPSPQASQASSSSSRLYPRHSRQSTAHPYSQRHRYPVHARDVGRSLAQVIALQEDLVKLREETNKEHAHKDNCMAGLLAEQLVYAKLLKATEAGRLEAEQVYAELKEVVQEKIKLVAARDKTIAERDTVIVGKDATIAARDKELFGKNETIRRLNGRIADLKMHLQHIEDGKLKVPLAKTSYDALCEAQDAFEREKEQFEKKKRAVEMFHKERADFEVEKSKVLEQHKSFVKENELLQREATQSKKALEDLQIEARRMRVRISSWETLAARHQDEPEDAEMRSASSSATNSLGSIAAPNPFASAPMGAFTPRPAPGFAPRHTPATPALTFTPRPNATFTPQGFPPQTPASAPGFGFNFSVARAVPTWTPAPALAEERVARPVKNLPRRRMRPQ